MNASVGVQIIGSPRTLNEVLTTSGQPVFSLNLDIKSYIQKTINLWENVWYDFGSCSNLNQYDYFNKSMILFYNLNHKYKNCFYYDYLEYCNYYYNDDLQPIYDNDNLRYII